MKKRIGVLLLALTMLFGSLTACSSAAETKVSSGNAGSGTAASAAGTAATEKGLVTLDWYTDFSWYPSDQWKGIIPDEITKKTNVTCDVTRAADGGQLGLMIASGELPDLIWTSDEIDRLCDPNLCYSYNELIEKYGIDWKPDAERIAIARNRNANADDENYYTILQNYNTQEEWEKAKIGVPGIAGIYYRKDIWKKMGSPEMNTIAQIKDVLKRVKTEFPDFQVINAGNPHWRLRGFENWYGASYDFLYEPDGSVVYKDLTLGTHDFLKLANEFYNDGYFNDENLAITVESDAYQQAINGKCFLYEWNARPTQLSDLNSKTQANFPDAEWAYLTIPDDSADITVANAGWAGVFISKNCKDPEAAIRLVSFLNSPEGQALCMWGREGTDYKLDENGVPQFSDEWKAISKDTTKMAEVYNTNYFCTTQIHETYLYYSGQPQDVLDAFGRNSDKIKTTSILAMAKPKKTDDAGIILSKIEEARKGEIVKIITAKPGEEFEKAYADYMNLLKKIGVEEMDKAVNEKVQELTKKS